MPQPVPEGSYTRAAALFAGLIALVVLAYFFGDRQLAGALRPYTNGVPFFIWLTYVVKPLTVAACLTVAIVAIIAIRKPELSPLCSGLLRIACAILVAGVLTFELKEAFGRTWPETWINNNPSYFGNGTYGFFPFHGGQGWASFPSGHTTAVSALAGALWFLWPELRWLGVALVLAVAVGLLGADYHWLSDILAGGIVGGTTGAAAARIGRHTGV
jgi:membrane-associated phospholipid phosphatase